MRLLGESILSPPIGNVLSWGATHRDQKRIIDASQGTSGVRPPAMTAELLRGCEAYGERLGSIRLRHAIAADVADQYGSQEVHEADVLVTAGCNEAFCAAIGALARPGERVLLLRPYYFNHDMWLRLNGIEPVYLDLPHDGEIDPELLAGAAHRVVAVCAVSPSNPTGTELTPSTIRHVITLCRDRNLPFILDETYAVFRRDSSGVPHDIFQCGDWRDYFISLRSLSKEFSIPGMRVGAVVAEPSVLACAAKWHDCMTIVAPRAGQAFAEYALGQLGPWRSDLAANIRQKGERFVAEMAAAGGPFVIETWGAFFAWVVHPFGNLTDEGAAMKLAHEAGVLTVPGAYFSTAETGRLRLSFAGLDAPRLSDVVNRLREVAA
jgi:aspartate/methionine/tyrosine aminotransferase